MDIMSVYLPMDKLDQERPTQWYITYFVYLSVGGSLVVKVLAIYRFCDGFSLNKSWRFVRLGWWRGVLKKEIYKFCVRK